MKIHWFWLLILASLILLSGCGTSGTPVPASPTPSPAPAPQPVETQAGAGEGANPVIPSLAELVPTLAEVVPTRTPLPTATPEAVARGVIELVQETGLSGKTLFWLEYADWLNLGISLLYVLVGYLIGTWLIRWLLPRLVRRTKTPLDDRLLRMSGDQLRWLAVVLILRYATTRLSFIASGTKTLLLDVYFFLVLLLILVLLWRLINLAARQAEDQSRKAGRLDEAESLIVLAVWALRGVLLITAITFTLAHFAVNVAGFAVLIGILGVAFSLAGRDVLSDIISGAIILVDRPYRIGDRIELPSLDSWGDVVDIGMRSTRVLTLNNRMVIVPNSQIGKNQVVNYSYPDSSYYDMSNVVVAYDNDADQVVHLLTDAIRTVEGVLKDRDVDVLLMELTENQMLYWTGWWIASYSDRFYVHDRVNRAMMRALKEAGIVLPYRRGSLSISQKRETE